MNDTLKQIGATGIVPVVVLNKVSDAEPLAQALIKGDSLVQRLPSVQTLQKKASALFLKNILICL